MPYPGEKWYMAGTDGSGEYMVVAEGANGRIGYREIKPDIFRIRFEPNTDDGEILTAIKQTLPGWCPPQSSIGGDTFRFSVLGKGINSLRCGIDLGIKVMGGFITFNSSAPEFLRSLIEKPFNAEETPCEKPPQSDGFWIGATELGPTESMFSSWMTKHKKQTITASEDTDESEDESDHYEDEPEEEENEEEENEEESEETPSIKVAQNPDYYDDETLMMWMKEDKVWGDDGGKYYAFTAKTGDGNKVRLTTALKNICHVEAKKMSQNWNLGCSCTSCIRATKTAVAVYEQAKLDYAKKLEAEKPLTPEQLKEQAVTQASNMAKAAGDLAAALKAFGF